MFKLRLMLILSGIVLFLPGTYNNVYGQSYAESALLFSRTKPGGSARIQGMGGTQIALGGDYSSAFSNPAGLGMFNRSEFTISPALSSFSTKAVYAYDNNSTNENLSRFQIPGLSLVFNIPGNRDGNFISGSFAISMNRTNDFNRLTRYEGSNPDNTIIYYFIDNAFGETSSQFQPGGQLYNDPTGLSYHNFLINPRSEDDPPGSPTEYFTDIVTTPYQAEEIDTKGAMNQWSISYGANFMDKFFIGGGIGIGSLRYKTRKILTERFAQDPLLNTLELVETTDIRGTGINATLGTIVRPLDFLQVGVSYTTPTYFSLTETYEAEMSTDWRVDSDASASTDILTSEYSLTIPGKLSAGVAFISKYGLITGDIEFTDPSKAKYSSDQFSYTPENNEIKSSYQSVVNYRIGAEYRYNMFRVRAGYGVQTNPYQRDFNIDNKITSISGGLGVRLEKFYIDFALIHSAAGKIGYRPYVLFDDFGQPYGPFIDLTNKSTMGMITLGFTY